MEPRMWFHGIFAEYEINGKYIFAENLRLQ